MFLKNINIIIWERAVLKYNWSKKKKFNREDLNKFLAVGDMKNQLRIWTYVNYMISELAYLKIGHMC